MEFILENWSKISTDQRILPTGNEPEERKYKCSECPEAFYYKSGLQHHFESHKRQMEMDATLYKTNNNATGNNGGNPEGPNNGAKNSASKNQKSGQTRNLQRKQHQ